MTRYIIIGAGAVGASLAAQFQLSGIDYALVGRGAQIAHIREHGLRYQRPSGTRQITLNAYDLSKPPELTTDDILLLTVKSQDAASALSFWSWQAVSDATAADTRPIVTFQNGLATEAAAFRTFAHVYGASILTPARFTETGTVVVAGDPQVGVVTVGRFPQGQDETSNRIVNDLNAADYLAEATVVIRNWKSAKLLHNVRNVLELFAGDDALRASIGQTLVDEAQSALHAAGYTPASRDQRTRDISKWRIAPDSGIEAGQQSTWQSFKRGASSEVDFLNGEIVLLGRLHGVATPYNAAVQTLAGRLEREGSFVEALPIEAISQCVDKTSSGAKNTSRSGVAA